MFQSPRGTATKSNSYTEEGARIKSPVKDAASKLIASTANLNLIPRVGGRNKRPSPSTNWHEKIKDSANTSNWEVIRSWLASIQPSNHDSSTAMFDLGNCSMGSNKSSEASQRSGRMAALAPGSSPQRVSGGFWNRLIKRNGIDRYGLLSLDEDGLTPLHALLKACTEQSLILSMITVEPRAASFKTSKDRLPLHFAVVHHHGWSVIAAIIDAYPAALSSNDTKGMSPLQYAIANAVRESSRVRAPSTYWMKLLEDDEEPYDDQTEESSSWQEQQKQRWSLVHWLLLSSATHPQSSLSLGSSGKHNKPMLVEALVHAAPPAIISLLIGASVMMLSYDRKVTAFAASTLYTCITRHYPEPILRSLASQLLVFRNSRVQYSKVRDETGVGFVAAQYISGCFSQPPGSSKKEWVLSRTFFGVFQECIEDGQILEHETAVYDWWLKLEHLIAFCGTPKNSRTKRKNHEAIEYSENSSQLPRKYLLHAALRNTDTPPLVVRALLSFYPSSIRLPQLGDGALPLHIAATVRDYLPRHYEQVAFSNQQQYSSLELVLKADPSALWKRWNGLLPLHLAVAHGRALDCLKPLLDADPERKQLLRRDPKVGLYPFQLAAIYSNRSDEDSFRWTCVARNKFSNSVWQTKLDRDKAGEVLKVAEADNLLRLDTVFELLRLAPRAILGPTGLARTSHSTNGQKVAIGPRQLYLGFCYEFDNRCGSYKANIENRRLLEEAANSFRSNAPLPNKMQAWWVEMTCAIEKLPSGLFERNLMKVRSPGVPKLEFQDAPILHRALMSDKTPPEVLALLVASQRESLFTSLPGTSLLPIHIAALVPPYRPNDFETFSPTSLQILLNADPSSALTEWEGSLPLHLAIHTRRSLETLKILIDVDRRVLRIRDPFSDLLPFQLVSSQNALLDNKNCSTISEGEAPASLKQFNSVYCLLRLDPGAIGVQEEGAETNEVNNDHILATETESVSGSSESTSSCESGSTSSPESESSFQSSSRGTIANSLLGNYSRKSNASTVVAPAAESSSSATDESSFVVASRLPRSPRSPVRTKTPSSLMLLLSKSTVAHQGNLFDCDASVLSNVDVLSTLTSTMHTTGQRRFYDEDSDDESMDLFEYENDSITSTSEGSNYDDFAEDSGIQSVGLPSLIEGNKSQSDEESVGGDSTESLIFFMVRRTARSTSGKVGEIEAPPQVTLTKKTQRALLTELKGHSFVSRSTKDSVTRPSAGRASSNSRLRYVSNSDDENLSETKKMVWAGADFFKTSVPSFQIRAGENTEISSISASSGHQSHPEVRITNTENLQHKEHNGPTTSPSLLGRMNADSSDPKDLAQSGRSNRLKISDKPKYADVEKQRNRSQMTDAANSYSNGRSSKTYSEKTGLLGNLDASEAEESMYAEYEGGKVLSSNGGKTSSSCNPKTTSNPTAQCSTTDEGNGIVSLDAKQLNAQHPSSRPLNTATKGKVFDKTAMKWIEPVEAIQEASGRRYFDKQQMRWITPIAAETTSDGASKNNELSAKEAADTSTHFPSRPSKLSRNPFVRKPPQTRKKKLSFDNSADSPQNQIHCVMCNKANREVLMVPCKHLCLCRNCSSKQKFLSHCPLCSTPVADRMLIF